jgi:tRNA modification GTPase
MRIVIAGQPNAGKSSLAQCAGRCRAGHRLAIAGTTRDKIQQTLQIEGVPLHVIDTAGLRDSTDWSSRWAWRVPGQEIDTADAVLFLHDGARLWGARTPGLAARRMRGPVARPTPRCRGPAAPAAAGAGAGDRRLEQAGSGADAQRAGLPPGIALSTRTGEGLAALRAALLQAAGWQPVAEGSFMARQRHLQALERVAAPWRGRTGPSGRGGAFARSAGRRTPFGAKCPGGDHRGLRRR